MKNKTVIYVLGLLIVIIFYAQIKKKIIYHPVIFIIPT